MSITQRCRWCGKSKILKNNFLKNRFTENGFATVCKPCKSRIDNLDSFKMYLNDNNIYFEERTWNEAEENVLGKIEKKYKDDLPPEKKVFQQIMNKYMSLGNLLGNFQFKKSPNKMNEESNVSVNVKTDEKLIEKWGHGYTIDEYALFEKKYNRLIRSYSEKTEMHTEALLTYIRYRVKEEIATAKGDVKDAKEWGSLAQKAAQDAKINPSQMSKSDISGGVDVVSQLFEAVESEVGIIPFLPKLLEQPYDDADMIIWCIINYHRRLEEKPTVRYRDIYSFYDEMLKEHYKQNGFNDKQIEEFLKKRNNVFRDMEEIYIEPLYEQQNTDNESEEIILIEGDV